MRQYPSPIISIRTPSICILILLVSSIIAAAQHEKVLHAFGNESGDGALPSGGLIADAAGNFYGTTVVGGANDNGTVYELSPPVPSNPRWTETVLYSFTGGADGAAPYGNLAIDGLGNLYGTTNAGGNQNCFGGCGTVIELSPPAVQGGSWTETTIYTFSGNDGALPSAGLVFDVAGNLYSTTELGGVGSCSPQIAPGCGTVFELSPPTAAGGAWTESILYSFAGGNDGAGPSAPVVFDSAGVMYGMTGGGGNMNCPGGSEPFLNSVHPAEYGQKQSFTPLAVSTETGRRQSLLVYFWRPRDLSPERRLREEPLDSGRYLVCYGRKVGGLTECCTVLEHWETTESSRKAV
jgi:uncharacterized repeat protein (TIGR03803 family)